jgi:hypothetical protein
MARTRTSKQTAPLTTAHGLGSLVKSCLDIMCRDNLETPVSRETTLSLIWALHGSAPVSGAGSPW